MEEESLAATRIMLAGALVGAPVVRSAQDGGTVALKLETAGADGLERRLEWVRAEGELARFVAGKQWGAGTCLLVLGELAVKASTDRAGVERKEFYTLAHRIAFDEFSTRSQP